MPSRWTSSAQGMAGPSRSTLNLIPSKATGSEVYDPSLCCAIKLRNNFNAKPRRTRRDTRPKSVQRRVFVLKVAPELYRYSALSQDRRRNAATSAHTATATAPAVTSAPDADRAAHAGSRFSRITGVVGCGSRPTAGGNDGDRLTGQELMGVGRPGDDGDRLGPRSRSHRGSGDALAQHRRNDGRLEGGGGTGVGPPDYLPRLLGNGALQLEGRCDLCFGRSGAQGEVAL
jgi:hypothetical protein